MKFSKCPGGGGSKIFIKRKFNFIISASNNVQKGTELQLKKRKKLGVCTFVMSIMICTQFVHLAALRIYWIVIY